MNNRMWSASAFVMVLLSAVACADQVGIGENNTSPTELRLYGIVKGPPDKPDQGNTCTLKLDKYADKGYVKLTEDTDGCRNDDYYYADFSSFKSPTELGFYSEEDGKGSCYEDKEKVESYAVVRVFLPVVPSAEPRKLDDLLDPKSDELGGGLYRIERKGNRLGGKLSCISIKNLTP